MDIENGTEISANYGRHSNPPCGNCNAEIQNSVESTTAIHIGDITNGKKNEIPIWEALTYIFGISWNNYQNYLTLEKNEDLTTHSENISDSQNILLCPLCASLLTDMYQAYYKLEKVTNSLSVIQAVKNTRGNILNSFPIISNDIHANGLQSDHPPVILNTNEMEKLATIKGSVEEMDYFSVDVKCEPYANDEMGENDWGTVKSDSKRELIVKLERLSVEELNQCVRKTKCTGRRKISRKENSPTAIKELRRNSRETKKQSSGKVTSEKLFTGTKAKQSNSEGKKKLKFYPIKRGGKYVCPICNKSFSDHMYVRNVHMAVHRSETCPICGKKLSSRFVLRKHLKFVHNQGEESKLKKSCLVCGKLVRPNSLLTHMEIHGERERHKCAQCGKVYLKKGQYDEHVLTHDKKFVPFLCRHCGQTFNSQSVLIVHEKRHTQEKKFACDKCPSRFYVRADLEAHQSVHSSERPLVCEQCGKGFKEKQVFRRHLRVHQDEAQKGQCSFACELCGRMSKNSASLTHHKRIWHGKKKFICSYCGKRVLTQSRLDQHENLHRNNPNYVPRKAKTMGNESKIPQMTFSPKNLLS